MDKQTQDNINARVLMKNRKCQYIIKEIGSMVVAYNDDPQSSTRQFSLELEHKSQALKALLIEIEALERLT